MEHIFGISAGLDGHLKYNFIVFLKIKILWAIIQSYINFYNEIQDFEKGQDGWLETASVCCSHGEKRVVSKHLLFNCIIQGNTLGFIKEESNPQRMGEEQDWTSNQLGVVWS